MERNTEQKKKNVIVFLTDQQRYDTVGVQGKTGELTPNFDRMAQDGTYVPLAFTPQPVCGPARAVLQTGRYATTLGTYRNAIPLSNQYQTIADYFNSAGYETGYIGKWHLASGRREVHKEERGGYQWWLGANALEETSTPYNTIVYDNDNQKVKLPGYRVDALTDAAIRYVDEKKERPFFLFLSFLEPHFQNCYDNFPAPKSGKTRIDYMPPDLGMLKGTAWQHLEGYYGMVKRLDEALGRIQDALESLGLLEDTIVVFASDHGCHFKTRNSEYKRSCHESSIRIPMAFYGGPFTGGGKLREMVSLVDVAPTLLDACDIQVPEEMEGHSIMPLLHGNQKEWPQEVLVQISESQVGRAIRTKRWKYSVEALDKDPIQDSCSGTYTEQFLYDLEQDPYELDNLIESKAHEVVCKTLAKKLVKKIHEIEGQEVAILPVEKKKMGQRVVFEGEEEL